MKLYVWRGSGVLQNWSSGIVCVLARSLADAKQLARTEVEQYYDWLYLDDEEDRAVLEGKLSFLNNEPEIYDYPIAISKFGGE